MTYIKAKEWVAGENNILCINRQAAFAIVKFYPNFVWHPAHKGGIKCGYLIHYHLVKNGHKKHIWYFGE